LLGLDELPAAARRQIRHDAAARLDHGQDGLREEGERSLRDSAPGEDPPRSRLANPDGEGVYPIRRLGQIARRGHHFLKETEQRRDVGRLGGVEGEGREVARALELAAQATISLRMPWFCRSAASVAAFVVVERKTANIPPTTPLASIQSFAAFPTLWNRPTPRAAPAGPATPTSTGSWSLGWRAAREPSTVA